MTGGRTASGAAGTGPVLDWFLQAGAGADDRPAVATRTAGRWEEMTYGDLARAVDRVALRLGEHGVASGDRVVLAGEAGGAWLAVLLGVLRAGAVAVPLDPGLTPAERTAMVDRSEPAAVLGSDDLEDLAGGGGMEPPAPGAGSDTMPPAMVPGTEDPQRFATAEDEVAGAARADHRLEAPAMIVWTSGTTGAPKGVTLSLANVAYSVEQAVAGQSPGAGDRWLSVLPPHHLLELCCGVLPALASGGTILFARTLMPAEIAGIIRDRGITRMVAVPLLLRLLERAVPGSGLETAYCGGAPLDPTVVERYASHGIAVYQGYGLTEAAPTVAMNTPAHHRAGSVGRPLEGTEVRIDGAAGAGRGSGDGEILVRSPAVMLGYWGDRALTSRTVDAEGWLHTGDLGSVDDDGFLFVTGRAKRLVVLESGKKVQPEEVEAAVAASDLFAEVCVVPARGAGAGAPEQVCAVVVPTPAMAAAHPDPAALHQAAVAEITRRTSSLSGYKRPTVVKVHLDALPRTLKGSPRHTEVARMVEQGAL